MRTRKEDVAYLQPRIQKAITEALGVAHERYISNAEEMFRRAAAMPHGPPRKTWEDIGTTFLEQAYNSREALNLMGVAEGELELAFAPIRLDPQAPDYTSAKADKDWNGYSTLHCGLESLWYPDTQESERNRMAAREQWVASHRQKIRKAFRTLDPVESAFENPLQVRG